MDHATGLHFGQLLPRARAFGGVVVPIIGQQVLAVGREGDGVDFLSEGGIVERQAALQVGSHVEGHVLEVLIALEGALQYGFGLVVGRGKELDDDFVVGFGLQTQADFSGMHLRKAVLGSIFHMLGHAVDEHFETGGRRNFELALHEALGTQVGSEEVEQIVTVGTGYTDIAGGIGLDAVVSIGVEIQVHFGFQQFLHGKLVAREVDAIPLEGCPQRYGGTQVESRRLLLLRLQGHSCTEQQCREYQSFFHRKSVFSKYRFYKELARLRHRLSDGTGATTSISSFETGWTKRTRRACRQILPSGLERGKPYFRSPLMGQPILAS